MCVPPKKFYEVSLSTHAQMSTFSLREVTILGPTFILISLIQRL